MAADRRNTHTTEQRAFIVRRLAAFDQPRDITVLFAALFPGTACSENDVMATDPRVAVVSPELHMLFYSERARVVADKDAAIYADQNARLIVLSKDVDRLRGNNESATARLVLRQIAEETGAIGSKGGVKGKADTPASEQIDEIRVTYIRPPVPVAT